jgi:WD40 repeat protein
MNSIHLIMVLATGLIVARTSLAADPEVKFPSRWRGTEPPARQGYADPFPREVRLSADGRRLVVGWGGAAVWDLQTGRSFTLPVDTDREIYGVFLSPDGRWVVGDRGAGPEWELVTWDAATGKEIRAQLKTKREPGGGWRRELLGLDRDGGVWVVERVGVVKRFDVPSGKLTHTIMLPFTARDFGRVVVSPGGRWLALGGETVFSVRSTDRNANWAVVELHAAADEDDDEPQPTTCPIPVGFSPDDQRLLTYDLKGNVMALWAMGEKPARLTSRAAKLTPWTGLYDLAYTPDGKRFGFVFAIEPWSRASQELRIWDAATLAEVSRVKSPVGIEGFAFTPDGKRVVLTHPDGTLTVREWTSSK